MVNFLSMVRSIRPSLSVNERRDALITDILTGRKAFNEAFIEQYRSLHLEHGIDVGVSVLEHMQPHMDRLTKDLY